VKPVLILIEKQFESLKSPVSGFDDIIIATFEHGSTRRFRYPAAAGKDGICQP
jgi:hypothetical protein